MAIEEAIKTKEGGGVYRRGAEQRVRGRYTTGAGGQRTYHAPMGRRSGYMPMERSERQSERPRSYTKEEVRSEQQRER